MGDTNRKTGLIVKVGEYKLYWYTYRNKQIAQFRISKIGATEDEEYIYDILSKKQIIKNKFYPQIEEKDLKAIKTMLNFSYHTKENNSDATLWQLALYNIISENELVAKMIDLDQPVPDFKFKKKPGRKLKV